ncbi:MAG: diguanylate cyclase domain-containing protein [Acidimicrobiales bacterium]
MSWRRVTIARPQVDGIDSEVAGHRVSVLDAGPMGRVLSLLFVVSGITTLTSLLLPTMGGLQRSGVLAVGFAAVAIGIIAWFLPWDRWKPSTAMWISVPIAEALIGFHNYFERNDPYRYGLYFMVLYVWLGASQRRWSTVPLLPITFLAYEFPLVVDHRPAWAMWSALYALPIFMLVGETIGWLTSELRRMTASLEFQALHDPLTGLANRVVLEDRIASEVSEARQRNSYVGAVFLDVDRFKAINDTLGHERGDAVLCEVARRLRGSVRMTDTVARVGGDEFVVLIEDDDETVPHRIADRIKAALAAPFAIEGAQVPVAVSIGFAVGPGQDTVDLIRRSDEGMYAIKRLRSASAS